MSSEQRYRIKTVSEMTGIPRNTLLAWERRHNVLAPDRLENGYRLYSDDDVAVLRRLKAAVSGGMAISEALHALRAGAGSPLPGAIRAPLDELRDRLFTALVGFDRAQADDIAASLVAVPYATVIDEVFMPVLRRVGDEWAAGRVNVAEEHFAAAYVREQLVSMLLRLGASAARGPHVACVTFPGERHELALLALTVHLVLRGCRITYLGADVPDADLAAFLRDVRPDVLCVSAILRLDEEALVTYARRVRRAAPRATRIIVGGAGLPADVRPPKGVDLLPDWRKLDLP